MAASTESSPGHAVGGETRRVGRELVLDLVFRPLSNTLVPVLTRAEVAPTAVVLANALVGLVAALALARGQLLVAAALLQVKTLLDNTDGQLARASGRVTLLGRYLDTEADLVVNAALFGALGHVTGEPLLAAAGFVALTLVLAVDFNVTELERETLRPASAQPVRSGGRVERLLERIYVAAFAPLDRLVRGLSEQRLERLVPVDAPAWRTHEARLAYRDRLTVTVLANLGLSTQLAVLGTCLVFGVPVLYLWIVLGCLLLIVPLQLRAERRARAALAA